MLVFHRSSEGGGPAWLQTETLQCRRELVVGVRAGPVSDDESGWPEADPPAGPGEAVPVRAGQGRDNTELR